MPYAKSADHPASVSLAGVSERTIALQRVIRPSQVLKPPRSRTLVQPSQARTRFFISPRLLYKAYLSLSRFKIRVGGVRPNYLISGWKIHTHGMLQLLTYSSINCTLNSSFPGSPPIR